MSASIIAKFMKYWKPAQALTTDAKPISAAVSSRGLMLEVKPVTRS